MTKNNQINNDIDLIELLKIIWEGKSKIFATLIISVISVFIFLNIQEKNNKSKKNYFTSTTEIKTLASEETIKYFSVIDYMLTNANVNEDEIAFDKNGELIKKFFLDLYVEALNDKKFFREAIEKYELIDINSYSDQSQYNQAVNQLVSNIEIITRKTSKKEEENELPNYYIQIKYDDVEKWESVMLYVDKLSNQKVKKYLQNHFQNLFAMLRQQRNYKIEDINIQIDNLINDYDRQTSDRIFYLKEQSEIAKKLGVSKNTIEVQTLFNQNTYLSRVNKESPFYLRGYEAIDKEIELIRSRTDNKRAFITGLFDLEREIRQINQNKSIERVELNYQSTPINYENFYAAKLNILSTKYKYETEDNQKKLLIFFGIVMGLIIGILYVIIENVVQSQKITRK